MTDENYSIIPASFAITAMRDSGYKNTAYALAELIDNSIQAGAENVDVICEEEEVDLGSRYSWRTSRIAVLDDGDGMDAHTLRMSLQFGRGTRLEDRSGMGRFGWGLPAASISQSKVVRVYTWQRGAQNALTTCLDVERIEAGEGEEVPDPHREALPQEWEEQASHQIRRAGTLILWDNLDNDRMSWRRSSSALKHTGFLVGRMYRHFIVGGDVAIRFRVYRGGELYLEHECEANDPLYLMKGTSTPDPYDEQPMFQEHDEKTLDIEGHPVTIRASYARMDSVDNAEGKDRGRTDYGKHAADNMGVSLVRADREIVLDTGWVGRSEPRDRWWGIEVEFPPGLDEVFGVTNNKQAATHFSNMAYFDPDEYIEGGESYVSFKNRLLEEGDPHAHLLEVRKIIRNFIEAMRTKVRVQGEGRRTDSTRHEGQQDVVDRASPKMDVRAMSHPTPGDSEKVEPEEKEKSLLATLKNEGYDPDVAIGMVNRIILRERRVDFLHNEVDSDAFFLVKPQKGGVIFITLNTGHPAYKKLEQLLRMNEENMGDLSSGEVDTLLMDAHDTLKMLFIAWARFEEETPDDEKEGLRGMRRDWGRMAREFLKEN